MQLGRSRCSSICFMGLKQQDHISINVCDMCAYLNYFFLLTLFASFNWNIIFFNVFLC
jgi:hypothetical protein